MDISVRNSGQRQGDEVVQLYARHLNPSRPMPRRSLRSFARVPLRPGERRTVGFTLVPSRDFAYYDDTKQAFTVDPGEYEIEIGASSGDIRVATKVRVQ